MNWFQAILLKFFPARQESTIMSNEFAGRKDLIKSVQARLEITADGIAGKQTFAAIADILECPANIFAIKRALKLPDNGIDDEETWNEIIKRLDAEEEDTSLICGISKKAYNLILYYETGGKEYYNKYLQSPSYPGGASGVTIGVGYDIGYNTLKQFESDWKRYLDPAHFERLKSFLGQKGVKVQAAIPGLKDIKIKWDSAKAVFQKSTLPRFIERTLTAFPGADALDPNIFGALVSVVFNRGGSMRGKTRREMVNIRHAISEGILSESELKIYISDQIRHMKRLWVGKGLDGLLLRRDAEADLVMLA